MWGKGCNNIFGCVKMNRNFFEKSIDKCKKMGYTFTCAKHRRSKGSLSSVGQSNRLITGGSKVRILEGAPLFLFIFG